MFRLGDQGIEMNEDVRQINEIQLGFIQNVITRVAQNSFQAKAWCITVDSALLAICLKRGTEETINSNDTVIWIAIIATILFLLVANYYHYLEVQYRHFYDIVAGIDSSSKIEIVNYSVSLPKELKSPIVYVSSFRSFATGGFFGIIILLLLLVKAL